MDVSEAVAARRSIRDFLADPVDDQLLRDLLEHAPPARRQAAMFNRGVSTCSTVHG